MLLNAERGCRRGWRVSEPVLIVFDELRVSAP
jgi:hypothetical protein